MDLLRKRGRPPKFDKILSALRADILSGRFQPGDRLPTREDLATKFGSTKVTIQKAMDVLLEEGILSARRGAGTYVTGEATSKLPYYLIVNTKPGFSRFKDALVKEAKIRTEEKHTLIVCQCDGPDHTSAELTRLHNLISRQRVAGIIVAGPYTNLKGAPFLDSPEIPKVFIGKDAGPYTSIDYKGHEDLFAEVLDYFRDHGCKNAAVITCETQKDLLERSPFRALAAQRSIETPAEWELAAPAHAPLPADRITRLLFSCPHVPEALHIADDNAVPAVTRALKDMGIEPPRDLLVTAHANFPYPTTSHVKARRIGYDARQFINEGLDVLNMQRQGSKTQKRTLTVIWEDNIEHTL